MAESNNTESIELQENTHIPSSPKRKGFSLLGQNIDKVAKTIHHGISKATEKVRDYKETHEIDKTLLVGDILYAAMVTHASANTILQRIKNGNIFHPDKMNETKEKEYPQIEMDAYGDETVFDILAGVEEKGDRKIVIITEGGAQAGSIGGGTEQGMADTSLADETITDEEITPFDRADATVGVSAGALINMWIAAGCGEDGLNIIDKENTQNVNLSNDPKEAATQLAKLATGKKAPIINAGAFAQWAKSTRPLNLEAIRNSKKDVWIVVTNVDTGRPEYLNMARGEVVVKNEEEEWETSRFDQTDENMLDGMTGGVNLTAGLDEKPYITMKVGETVKKYVDGGITDYLPLDFALSRGYTHALIISNFPLNEETSLSERFIFYILAKMSENQNVYPPRFIEACHKLVSRKAASIRQIKKLLDEKQHVAIIAPRKGYVDPLERDGKFLRYIINSTRTFSRNFWTDRKKKHLEKAA